MPTPDPNLDQAVRFLESIRGRRSVREFSDRPVSQAVIEHLIAAAGSAPSGANKQPWRFVAVQDPEIKREIREAAEKEERKLYEGRANPEWLEDLAPLGTNAEKSFLETAPWLVIVFKQVRNPEPEQGSEQVYYVNESVGIACGLFITALHTMGLATLTHTPSPMGFLTEIFQRPATERPYILFPVGYPSDDCQVPDLQRKPLDESLIFFPSP